jgi:DNA-binding response OmpR family regulator
MPGIDGFEFAKMVREIQSTIKIIFMTAFDINDIEYYYHLSTLDGFIQKPFSPNELILSIEKHLKR